jgi:hypothetical protein
MVNERKKKFHKKRKEGFVVHPNLREPARLLRQSSPLELLLCGKMHITKNTF